MSFWQICVVIGGPDSCLIDNFWCFQWWHHINLNNIGNLLSDGITSTDIEDFNISGCDSIWKKVSNIDSFGQNCHDSIANALELPQSCTKPSIWFHLPGDPCNTPVCHESLCPYHLTCLNMSSPMSGDLLGLFTSIKITIAADKETNTTHEISCHLGIHGTGTVIVYNSLTPEWNGWHFADHNIDGLAWLVQERRNSIANALGVTSFLH